MLCTFDQTAKPAIEYLWSMDCTLRPPGSMASWNPGKLNLDAATEVVVACIDIGETHYQFLANHVCGRFLPKVDGSGDFRVPETGELIVGHGKNTSEACDDWKMLVDMHFQRLYGLRPFQMTDEEHELWQMLTSLINVQFYQTTTPFTFTEVGKVSKVRPFPTEITWIDGSKESIAPRFAPGIFRAMKPGQWFEALVKRDPVNKKLIQLVDVRKIPEVRELTETEEGAFWDSLDSSRILPVAEQSWASRNKTTA